MYDFLSRNVRLFELECMTISVEALGFRDGIVGHLTSTFWFLTWNCMLCAETTISSVGSAADNASKPVATAGASATPNTSNANTTLIQVSTSGAVSTNWT